MAVIFKNFLVIVLSVSCFVSLLPQKSWAQAQAETSSAASDLTGTRKQIATIIFSGLAGAILGLSTLSFYGRPQEKLSNIAVGFAIGIIGGVVVTTYNVARSPYEGLSMQMQREEIDELTKRFEASTQFKTFAPTLVSWNF